MWTITLAYSCLQTFDVLEGAVKKYLIHKWSFAYQSLIPCCVEIIRKTFFFFASVHIVNKESKTFLMNWSQRGRHLKELCVAFRAYRWLRIWGEIVCTRFSTWRLLSWQLMDLRLLTHAVFFAPSNTLFSMWMHGRRTQTPKQHRSSMRTFPSGHFAGRDGCQHACATLCPFCVIYTTA